jgi:hypothetical protein
LSTAHPARPFSLICGCVAHFYDGHFSGAVSLRTQIRALRSPQTLAAFTGHWSPSMVERRLSAVLPAGSLPLFLPPDMFAAVPTARRPIGQMAGDSFFLAAAPMEDYSDSRASIEIGNQIEYQSNQSLTSQRMRGIHEKRRLGRCNSTNRQWRKSLSQDCGDCLSEIGMHSNCLRLNTLSDAL